MLANSSIYATNEIISSQLDELNLSKFVKEGEEYTKEVFKDINVNSLIQSAITGNMNNKTIYTSILELFGKVTKKMLIWISCSF